MKNFTLILIGPMVWLVGCSEGGKVIHSSSDSNRYCNRRFVRLVSSENAPGCATPSDLVAIVAAGAHSKDTAHLYFKRMWDDTYPTITKMEVVPFTGSTLLGDPITLECAPPEMSEKNRRYSCKIPAGTEPIISGGKYVLGSLTLGHDHCVSKAMFESYYPHVGCAEKSVGHQLDSLDTWFGNSTFGDMAGDVPE